MTINTKLTPEAEQLLAMTAHEHLAAAADLATSKVRPENEGRKATTVQMHLQFAIAKRLLNGEETVR